MLEEVVSTRPTIKPHLERGTPIYSIIQCMGEYAKDFPSQLRALVKTSVYSDKSLRSIMR